MQAAVLVLLRSVREVWGQEVWWREVWRSKCEGKKCDGVKCGGANVRVRGVGKAALGSEAAVLVLGRKLCNKSDREISVSENGGKCEDCVAVQRKKCEGSVDK